MHLHLNHQQSQLKKVNTRIHAHRCVSYEWIGRGCFRIPKPSIFFSKIDINLTYLQHIFRIESPHRKVFRKEYK